MSVIDLDVSSSIHMRKNVDFYKDEECRVKFIEEKENLNLFWKLQ